MTINLTALQKQRYDTAANWTGANPTLLAGEIGIESDTLRWKVGNGSTAWTSLGYIPGLAYGTARQLLQTNSGATAAEWTSNVDIPGTLDVTGTSTLDGMVLMGTTTSIGGGKLQLSSDTTTTIQNFSFNATADSSTAMLQFIRGRGTKASPSVVLNGDYLGEIRFLGYGTTYNTGASIRAIVDGDPATAGDTSDMPTKLVFLTSPNGSSTPDTRMTIDSAGLVTIPGDLTVNGTTTTINSTTLVVQDKNIEMGVVATPTDVTADGGGITLKGTTDKTINWIDATDAWTLSEHVNIASAKEYRIAGTKVLDATSLGSAVVSSSLTSVGTIGTGVWQGTAIADTYLGTISTALKVSNSATTATSANTASAIVARDASGNFTAGTITASLAGNAATVTTNANLTGDVTSVGNATSIAAGVIVDADINASAAIVDTKLATIATAGKVSNSATTATDANTASAIVARDASGNFTAGTITAALTGAASSNVLKAGDTMTGVLAVTAGTAALPAITPSGDPNTGIYSPGADQLAISTGGTGRLFVASDGKIGIGSSGSGTQSARTFIEGSGACPLEIDATAGSGGYLTLSNSGSAKAFFGFGSNIGTASVNDIAIRSQSGALAFQTGGANERLRITSAGLVGVGSSSPQCQLTNTGNSSFGTNSWPTTDVGNSAGRVLIGNEGQLMLWNETVGAGNTAVIMLGAKTGAGANTLGYSAVRGGTENASNRASFMRLETCNSVGTPSTAVYVDSSQRVGIGTTSPGAKLQVETSADDDGITINSELVSRPKQLYFRYSNIGSGGAVKSDGPLTFWSGSGTPFERCRLDGSGRLLVGTPTSVGGESVQISNGTTANTLGLYNSTSSIAGAGTTINFRTDGGATGRSQASIAGLQEAAYASGGRLVFSTTADGAPSPTPRMTITNNGRVIIGTTNDPGYQATVVGTNSYAFLVRQDVGNYTYPTATFHSNFTTGDNKLLDLITDAATLRGSITYNRAGGVIAYNTTSDYRAKTVLGAVESPGETIDALKVYRGVMNGATVERPMLVAHEAQEVAPYCVTGKKDAVDDDGNPIYQQMDHQVLVPLLIAEIQQLRARVAALEAA